MESLLDMMMKYTANVDVEHFPVFPAVSYKVFHNNYDDFDDTNNISLVTFLNCRETFFIIPGDLEAPGWELLLKNSDFKDELKNLNVFIASHHGRESGYCRKVFDFCKPDIIIFSDSEMKYTTQEMASTYGNHF